MAYSSFIKQDYKSALDSDGGVRRRLFRPLHLLVLGAAAVSGGFLFTSAPEDAVATREQPAAAAAASASEENISQYSQEVIPLPGQTAANPVRPEPGDTPTTTAKLTPPQPDLKAPATAATNSQNAVTEAASAPTPPPSLKWQEVTVASGDSLARIFHRLDLSAATLHDIIQLSDETKRLTRIHPGQKLQIQVDDSNRIHTLKYEYDQMHALLVSRTDDDFSAREVVREPEHIQKAASAEIKSSLFLAGQRAGLSDNLIMELAGIFGWDIDFALDIRKGDRFSVLYDELSLDGEKIGNGDILAAEFVNQGRTYRAVRYTTAEGKSDYYSPDGRSMRKAFLRTPVAFSRISSRFSLGRKHPILNRIRAHKGVDYAAPYGTPIKSTGNGKIIYHGTKGGYGRVIIIKHGTRYSTLYAHMSRYARGLKTGSRVKQGQVIGYVGKSGLATGPHLHYEFRIDGVHRNPLTVDLPDAEPIEAKYRKDFEHTAKQLLAELEVAPASSSQVALNQQQ